MLGDHPTYIPERHTISTKPTSLLFQNFLMLQSQYLLGALEMADRWAGFRLVR